MNNIRMITIAQAQQKPALIKEFLIKGIRLTMSYCRIQDTYSSNITQSVMSYLIYCRKSTLADFFK